MRPAPALALALAAAAPAAAYNASAPIPAVVEIRPGAVYAATLGCAACPYLRETTQGPELLHRDLSLLFNVSLAPDRRAVLLNGQPFFPALPTVPRPPTLRTPQLRPDFSYADLAHARACRNPTCAPGAPVDTRPACAEWCHALQLGAVTLDYLYTASAITTITTTTAAAAADAHTRYWTVAVDALAGHGYAFHDDPSWTWDRPQQKMLQVRVAGVADHSAPHRSSSLFDPAPPANAVYQLRIDDVQLVPRAYRFPPPEPLTAWAKVVRFFGNDVWEEPDHRLLYLAHEWGLYGKEGSLRNLFGKFVHWENWHAFWLALLASVGGVVALFCAYKLFFWIRHQRELMKWNGMDDVWDKLRRDREREEQEEQDALLSGRYRDDPLEAASSSLPRYTDDVDTMKPLPTKPLPEKPLPDVPLIDT